MTVNEPLEKTSPLWHMPNVLLYPHSAAIDADIRIRAVTQFEDNITKWERNEQMKGEVDHHKGF